MYRNYFLVLLALAAAVALNAQALTQTCKDISGRILEEDVIPGIPEGERVGGPVAVPTRSSVILSGVPALDWCYGCYATSAAMLAGYWDRHNHTQVYTGPMNGGLMPLTNADWDYGECPLSATHSGYDGLATAGHVDRFWVGMGQSGNDPFGTTNPTGTYGGCTADYTGTSQDWWSNSDGSTRLYYTTDGTPLSDYMLCETTAPRKRDGTHGLKLFFTSRGVTVTANYNQRIAGYNGVTAGFTFSQFKSFIDQGIPVLIHVVGHTMLGVGYDTSGSLVYIHDTWDHNLHSMAWGGSYSGRAHTGVSVITLAAPSGYTISGVVVDDGQAPLAGVTITGGSGYSAVTNSAGQYDLNVPALWSGSVTPASQGHVFLPGNATYSNVSSNLDGQDYTGIDTSLPPENVAISSSGSAITVSWEAKPYGTYKVYALNTPDDTQPVNVTSQGTLQTVSGRVKWTTTATSAAQRFYRVTVSY